MRNEDVQFLGSNPSAFDGFQSFVGDVRGGPAKHSAPIHADHGHPLLRIGHVGPVLDLDGEGLGTVGTPDDGSDGGFVARADDSCPSSVGEQERGGAVLHVDHVTQGLDADHQNVGCCPRSDERFGDADSVAETGARRRDVKGNWTGAQAEFVGNIDGQ